MADDITPEEERRQKILQLQKNTANRQKNYQRAAGLAGAVAQGAVAGAKDAAKYGGRRGMQGASMGSKALAPIPGGSIVGGLAGGAGGLTEGALEGAGRGGFRGGREGYKKGKDIGGKAANMRNMIDQARISFLKNKDDKSRIPRKVIVKTTVTAAKLMAFGGQVFLTVFITLLPLLLMFGLFLVPMLLIIIISASRSQI